jgi:acetyl esterase/lipase
MSRQVLLITGLLLLPAAGSASAASATSSHTGQVIQGITYCRNDDGQPQKLDLLYPTVRVTYPRPVVLWVHGGTWVKGNRFDAYSNLFVRGLRRAGFIVATMDYSLAPAHRFPAAAHDLTCGVRSLRARASSYAIDPSNIGAMGGSAGGHLVEMLGVDDGSAEFIDHGYPNYSSDVQAVAALWGVSDLTQNDLGPTDRRMLPRIFGDSSKWAAASPISYVRPGLPPFLFVHGSRDTDVPPRQSKRMSRKLIAQGVSSKVIIVAHAEHRLKPSGGAISPPLGTVINDVVSFFDRTLRN